MQIQEVTTDWLLSINAGEFYALSPACPHRSARVEGRLVGTSIECPWHHYRHNVRSETLYLRNVDHLRNVYPTDLPGLQQDLQPIGCDQWWLKVTNFSNGLTR